MNNKNEKELWDGLQKVFEIKDTMISPISNFRIGGLSVFIWRKFTLSLYVLETEPYRMDGEVPMVFLQIGPIEFVFENKFIYKRLYKREFGYLPRGL
jgi:hypothetical protein